MVITCDKVKEEREKATNILDKYLKHLNIECGIVLLIEYLSYMINDPKEFKSYFVRIENIYEQYVLPIMEMLIKCRYTLLKFVNQNNGDKKKEIAQMPVTLKILGDDKRKDILANINKEYNYSLKITQIELLLSIINRISDLHEKNIEL
ncbi:unnamed protein product [Gordionus sp. m RMFG-2023]